MNVNSLSEILTKVMVLSCVFVHIKRVTVSSFVISWLKRVVLCFSFLFSGFDELVLLFLL